jgi:methionine--tRNA ligase beta chain
MANIEDFKRIEIKAGQIKSAERVEGSEKLLKLSVDLGEPDPRQILAGIGPYFEDVSVLVGKKAAFVSNMEPRKLMGLESQGMILAALDGNNLSLLEISGEISLGTRIS